MRKGSWKSKINKMLKEKGIDFNEYVPVVETLAGILEERDKTYSDYIDSGECSVIEYTNKAGATNITKNPRIVMWNDLNSSALTYWRELGLTPSSFKKMTGDSVAQPKKSALGEALASIEF